MADTYLSMGPWTFLSGPNVVALLNNPREPVAAWELPYRAWKLQGFVCGRWVEHLAQGLHAPVSALHLLFVVRLEQDGADEAVDGGFVGDDAADIGAALHLLVQSFQRERRMQLGPLLRPVWMRPAEAEKYAGLIRDSGLRQAD